MSDRARLSAALVEAIQSAAEARATPFYLTIEQDLIDAAQLFEDAFPDPWIRSYSLKADPLPEVVTILANRGWGANCVSVGEIIAARLAGVENGNITLEGIGKGEEEFSATIEASASGHPLRWIALESLDEARALVAAVLARCEKSGAPIRTLIRLNPAIEPGGHSGLAVGLGSSKFGTDRAELIAAARIVAAAGPPLQLVGIHLHAGSQLRDLSQWQTAVERSISAYGELVAEGLIAPDVHCTIGTLCIGGGEPVTLEGAAEHGPSTADFARAADVAWSNASCATPPLRAIEPGRALVAEATYLVARVLHVRARREIVRAPLALPGEAETVCERQAVLDAGMGELIRPALYGARHPVHAVASRTRSDSLTAAHGPICESTDALGAHLLPGDLARGDLVAIAGAGAYADAMWSPYNSRPRPERLLLAGSQLSTIRIRGS